MNPHNERLRKIRLARAESIRKMRERGLTLTQIGIKLGGISKQAVHQILLRK